jgi:hypothetical protein
VSHPLDPEFDRHPRDRLAGWINHDPGDPQLPRRCPDDVRDLGLLASRDLNLRFVLVPVTDRNFDPGGNTNWRSLWSPRFWDRRVWQDGETEKRRDVEIIAKADAAWREILRNAPAPQVDEALVAEVRQVVDRARRELVG